MKQSLISMGSSKPFMERNKAAVLYTLGGLILLAVILGLALGLGLPKLSSGSTPSPVPCVMATAIMTNTTSGINGFITFQTTASGGVNVTVKLTGVTTNTGFQNGLHVHANLVTSTTENLCVAAGGHFAPVAGSLHGSPASTSSATRHVGDLGNVPVDSNGNVDFSLIDDPTLGISLSGTNNIVGRAIILHANVDDLGKGSGSSTINGNSGDRICCAVISSVTCAS